MPFHKLVRGLLLINCSKWPSQATSKGPKALDAIAEAVATKRKVVTRAARSEGNNCRSAFWAIYLFSALAVL